MIETKRCDTCIHNGKCKVRTDTAKTYCTGYYRKKTLRIQIPEETLRVQIPEETNADKVSRYIDTIKQTLTKLQLAVNLLAEENHANDKV